MLHGKFMPIMSDVVVNAPINLTSGMNGGPAVGVVTVKLSHLTGKRSPMNLRSQQHN